jgi:hypothetical protein
MVNTETLEDRGGILATAHLLLCKMMQLHNEHFGLGLEKEVDEAIDAFNETWKEAH